MCLGGIVAEIFAYRPLDSGWPGVADSRIVKRAEYAYASVNTDKDMVDRVLV